MGMEAVSATIGQAPSMVDSSLGGVNFTDALKGTADAVASLGKVVLKQCSAMNQVGQYGSEARQVLEDPSASSHTRAGRADSDSL